MDRTILNGWMLPEHLFNLAGIDVESAADDEILCCDRRDGDSPQRPQKADIARPKPTVFECSLRRFKIALITLAEIAPPADNLTPPTGSDSSGCPASSNISIITNVTLAANTSKPRQIECGSVLLRRHDGDRAGRLHQPIKLSQDWDQTPTRLLRGAYRRRSALRRT